MIYPILSHVTELKLVADESHKLMVDALKEARKMSEELDSLFKERNFLKSEGDRYHNSFVEEKRKLMRFTKRLVN